MTQLELLEPVEGDPCFRKHGGDPESRSAFLITDRQKQQLAVWTCIAQHAVGRTLDEVAELMGAAPNQISGRITELKRKGKLIYTGMRRPTRTGCLAKVYKAVDNLQP